jgi:hypothetical protein
VDPEIGDFLTNDKSVWTTHRMDHSTFVATVAHQIVKILTRISSHHSNLLTEALNDDTQLQEAVE